MLNKKTKYNKRPARPQPYPAPIQGYQLSATSTTGKAPVCNELLELVIQRENLSVVRLVWFILARTAPAYDLAQPPATMLHAAPPSQPYQPHQQQSTPPQWGEVEVSYSELQRTLGLSRCAVYTGLNRAIEAGYILRTTEGNTTQRPARYAPNFALVTPTPPPPPGSNPPGGSSGSSGLTPFTSPRPGQDHATTGDRLTTIPGPDPAAFSAFVPTISSPNPGPSAQEEPGSHLTPVHTERDKHGSAVSSALATPQLYPANWSENHQTKATATPTPTLCARNSTTASQHKFPPATGIMAVENQTSNPTTTCSACHLALNSTHADPDSGGGSSAILTYPSDFQTGSLNDYEPSLHDSNLESLVESSRNLESLPAPAGPVCNPYQSCQQQHHYQPQHQATPGPDHAAGNPTPPTTSTTTTASTPTSAAPLAPAPPTNPYLTNLSEELSRELGDAAHHRSNRTQLLNLWQKSGLSPDEFAQIVYHSRELTHRYATLRPGEKLPGNGQPRNKMAYFFRVVRDKLFGTGQVTAALALAVGSNTVTTTNQVVSVATGQHHQHGQSAPVPVVTPTPASSVTLTASQQRLIPQPTKSLNSTTTPSPTSACTQTMRTLPTASPLAPAAAPSSIAPSSCSTPLPTFAGTKTPYQPRPGYGQREHDNHRAMSASPGNSTDPGSASQPQRPRLSPQPQPPYQPKPKPTTGPAQPPRYHERGYSFDRPASPIPESWRRLMGGSSNGEGSNSGRAAPAT